MSEGELYWYLHLYLAAAVTRRGGVDVFQGSFRAGREATAPQDWQSSSIIRM